MSYVAFVYSFFDLISHSFGASGRLCFVIVAFPGYLRLHFYIVIDLCLPVNRIYTRYSCKCARVPTHYKTDDGLHC